MKIVVVYCPIHKEIFGVFKKGSISEKELNELGGQDYYIFEETLLSNYCGSPEEHRTLFGQIT